MLSVVQEKFQGSNLLLPNLAANPAEPLSDVLVEQFVSSPLPREYGAALVDDWDCLRVSASHISVEGTSLGQGSPRLANA